MRYELRPLGVGGVLDQSIALFKDRLGLFVTILLILRIPTTAVMQYAVLSNMAQMPLSATDAQMNEFFGRMMRLYFFVLAPWLLFYVFVVAPLSDAALIYATGRSYLGQSVTLRESLRAALRRYFPMLWTSILFYLIYVFGLLFCFLPGILLFAYFALSTTIAVLEPTSGVGALGRCRDLMRSIFSTNYVNIFLLLTALVVFQWFMGATSGFIPQIHLQVLASAVLGSISYSFFIVAQVVYYYSCRCRIEGFDLLQLARVVAETPVDQPPALESQG
jgi:hypothetical protein